MNEPVAPNPDPSIPPPPKTPLLFSIGVGLIAFNYVLLVPTLILAAMGIGERSWFWGKLSAFAYVISWVFFIVGFIAAGPHAVQTVRRWIRSRLRPAPPPEDGF